MPMSSPELQREYQRQWRAKRRAEFFNGKYCTICKSTERLELDHIDPATKVDHKIWSWSDVRRAEEIAKCQVLCYDCHLKKTILEKLKEEHGTRNTYMKHNCRCDLCCAAASRYRQNQRKGISNHTPV